MNGMQIFLNPTKIFDIIQQKFYHINNIRLGEIYVFNKKFKKIYVTGAYV